MAFNSMDRAGVNRSIIIRGGDSTKRSMTSLEVEKIYIKIPL